MHARLLVGQSFVNAPKTTVGIVLSETVVESTTFGSPAYNSQQLQRGDVITQVGPSSPRWLSAMDQDSAICCRLRQ